MPWLQSPEFFRLVDLRALQAGETRDFVERKRCEQLQETLDVAVLRVPPELPVLVRAQLVLIEPDSPGSGLAHLGTG